MTNTDYVIKRGQHVLLGNRFIEGSIDTGRGAGLVRLTNKITGRAYELGHRREVSLRFQSDTHCAWIRDWRFKMGSGEAVEPESELGFELGFHQPDLDETGWCATGLINDFPVSPAGYSAVLYPGYAWYRSRFDLPEDASGKPIEIAVGGTDNQDWLHYRYYLNGFLVGEASPQGHWHPAPAVVLDPNDPAYQALRFGETNLLAVQARGLDRSEPGMKMSDSERYSVGTWLVDQRVSVVPFQHDVSDFRAVEHAVPAASNRSEVVIDLVSDSEDIGVQVRYWIDGDEPAIHKQVLVSNMGQNPRILLEMDLGSFDTGADVSLGGLGLPCYVGGDVFCGVRHPSAVAQGENGALRLTSFPGRKLAPGESYQASAVVFGVGTADSADRAFVDYIERHGHRKRELLNMMHCYGMHDVASIDNPVSLTEQMVLGNLDILDACRKRGINFDWYWIDAGWYNPVGDLKDFDPAYFPEGAGRVFDRIHSLGMKTGLWTSPVCGPMAFHEGKGITNPFLSEPGAMCMAEGVWRGIYRDALLYHARENNVKGFKFDGICFVCNFPGHDHLPGKYSVEPVMNGLIDNMEAVRSVCPDVFYMLYWSIRSPWWLLWGDTIYERGVLMEGATPCDAPSALMRESITVSLDQATHHAWNTVPLSSGDSLGVWISQWRWGSYLKAEWWQGGWIMDIARGSLLCQLWGDMSMFGDEDRDFLADISEWMRRHSDRLHREPVRILGDPWDGVPYGYAYLDGGRGVVFAYNPTFEYQDVLLPTGASPESRSAVTTIYPRGDRQPYSVIGDTISLKLRPFEVRMLQIDPTEDASLPAFPVTMESGLSTPLTPTFTHMSCEPLSWEDDKAKPIIRRALNGRATIPDFRDGFDLNTPHDERDEHIVRRVLEGSVELPSMDRARSLLIVVRLSREGIYWHHRCLYDIIKTSISITGSDVAVSSTPYRWHEQAGMWSWILFRAPIEAADHIRTADLHIEACLPQDVDYEISALLFDE